MFPADQELPTLEAALPPTESPRTVREAQIIYRRSGEGSVHQGYRDVIKSLAKTGYNLPIRNDSYADALFLTDIMLEHTEKDFCMLSGPSSDGFLSTLEINFVKMLERLTALGGTVRVALLRQSGQPHVPSPYLVSLCAKYPVLAIASGVSAPQKHYIVSDSQMLRVEEEHPPLTADTPATAVKAQVYFDAPARAKLFVDHFNVIWNLLHPKK